MDSVSKIKTDISSAPIGGVVGGVMGYFLARNFGYDKTLSVISFVVVGVITGSILTTKFKKQ